MRCEPRLPRMSRRRSLRVLRASRCSWCASLRAAPSPRCAAPALRGCAASEPPAARASAACGPCGPRCASPPRPRAAWLPRSRPPRSRAPDGPWDLAPGCFRRARSSLMMSCTSALGSITATVARTRTLLRSGGLGRSTAARFAVSFAARARAAAFGGATVLPAAAAADPLPPAWASPRAIGRYSCSSINPSKIAPARAITRAPARRARSRAPPPRPRSWPWRPADACRVARRSPRPERGCRRARAAPTSGTRVRAGRPRR